MEKTVDQAQTTADSYLLGFPCQGQRSTNARLGHMH